MYIPSLLLKRLYTFGSLKNEAGGVRLSVKNRLSDARLTGITRLRIDDQEVTLSAITLQTAEGHSITPGEISPSSPIDFPLRQTLEIFAPIPPLPIGKHRIE